MLAICTFVVLCGVVSFCGSRIIDNIPSDSPLYVVGILLWLVTGTTIIGPALYVTGMFVWEKAQNSGRHYSHSEKEHPAKKRGLAEWWVIMPAIWAISMVYFMTNSLYSVNNKVFSPVFIAHTLGLAFLGLGLPLFRRNKYFTWFATLAILSNFIWLTLEAQSLVK